MSRAYHTGNFEGMFYVACMDKKISLDQANQIYYFYLPTSAQQTLFASVFAIDHFVDLIATDNQSTLYGYCLFDDALHLLLFCKDKPSIWIEPLIMQYHLWHQEVTGDTGYLLNDQERQHILIQPKFLPEWLRFIHRLPIIKRLSATCDAYRYSSYHLYLRPHQQVMNTQYALALISHHKGMRIRRFVDYMNIDQFDASAAHFCKGNQPFYHAHADEAYITKLLSSYYEASAFEPVQDLELKWENCVKLVQQVTGLETPEVLGKSRHHRMTDAHYVLAWVFTKVAKGPAYFVAKQFDQDETTIQLNVRSVELHHPTTFLRTIEERWNQIYSPAPKKVS